MVVVDTLLKDSHPVLEVIKCSGSLKLDKNDSDLYLVYLFNVSQEINSF